MVAPKALVPTWIRRPLRRLYTRVTQPSRQAIFTDIYRQNAWGAAPDNRPYSGHGSHDPTLVAAYVGAVRDFLLSLPERPVVVDLGCGDFNVGSRLTPFASRFVACDIVPELLAINRQRYPGVEFRHLDIVRGPLPQGDVCLVRQVFQHLDNKSISRALRNMLGFGHWIVTEHVAADMAEPNRDRPTGAGIRGRSGVLVDKPPFDFHGYRKTPLSAIPWPAGGVIRVDLFTAPGR